MERRRCLLLVYRLPWPPEAGGSLRDWQNTSVLSEWTDLSVVALRSHPRELPPKRVALWTTLDAEGLREPAPFDGSEVVLEREWWRNELGYPTDDCWSPFRASTLRRLLKTSDFDFAVLEDVVFWRYGEIVREFVPILIDYHNVQSRIEEEYLAFVRDCDAEERERAALALQTMRSVEQMYRELPAIVCSEAEREALVHRGFARGNIAVVNNTVDVGDDPPRETEDPPRILFAGMMDYLPNACAARQLVAEIFPRVLMEVHDAELWLVGMDPLPQLLRAAGCVHGVYVTGRVRETRSYFRSASALSVPLELGGGTRFKILEAFKYGVPVVTSPKGCEGLDVQHGEHVLIACSPDEHASALIEVLKNRDLARRLVVNADRLVREHYSFATAARQWQECLRRFPHPRKKKDRLSSS